MLRKAWIMAKTEIRMVFKSRQVKTIPVMIFLMTGLFAGLFTPLMLPLAAEVGVEFYDMMMAMLMGTSVVMMPAMLPAMIAADSIVGEKERHTLVPLLASPLTDGEILLGKFLTALIPGIIVAYANLVIGIAIVNGITLFMAPTLLWVWPSLLALTQALIFPPLLAAIAVCLMIMISGRVSKVYEAYQIAGFVIILPLTLVFTQLFLSTSVNWLLLFFGAAILGIADIGLFQLARNLFNRDKLISRV